MSYDPKPIDTSHVVLSREIAELTELLAHNAHDNPAKQSMRDGWRYGRQRNDVTREHPCLVPYEDLPESEKEYGCKAAMETVKTIVALGSRTEGQV